MRKKRDIPPPPPSDYPTVPRRAFETLERVSSRSPGQIYISEDMAGEKGHPYVDCRLVKAKICAYHAEKKPVPEYGYALVFQKSFARGGEADVFPAFLVDPATGVLLCRPGVPLPGVKQGCFLHDWYGQISFLQFFKKEVPDGTEIISAWNLFTGEVFEDVLGRSPLDIHKGVYLTETGAKGFEKVRESIAEEAVEGDKLIAFTNENEFCAWIFRVKRELLSEEEMRHPCPPVSHPQAKMRQASLLFEQQQLRKEVPYPTSAGGTGLLFEERHAWLLRRFPGSSLTNFEWLRKECSLSELIEICYSLTYQLVNLLNRTLEGRHGHSILDLDLKGSNLIVSMHPYH